MQPSARARPIAVAPRKPLASQGASEKPVASISPDPAAAATAAALLNPAVAAGFTYGMSLSSPFLSAAAASSALPQQFQAGAAAAAATSAGVSRSSNPTPQPSPSPAATPPLSPQAHSPRRSFPLPQDERTASPVPQGLHLLGMHHPGAVPVPCLALSGLHMVNPAALAPGRGGGLVGVGEGAAGGLSGRTGVGASRHMAAEQRRRARINERLDALRTLVPHSARANTAAFLTEVFHYIEHLHAELERVGGDRSGGFRKGHGAQEAGEGSQGEEGLGSVGCAGVSKEGSGEEGDCGETGQGSGRRKGVSLQKGKRVDFPRLDLNLLRQEEEGEEEGEGDGETGEESGPEGGQCRAEGSAAPGDRTGRGRSLAAQLMKQEREEEATRDFETEPRGHGEKGRGKQGDEGEGRSRGEGQSAAEEEAEGAKKGSRKTGRATAPAGAKKKAAPASAGRSRGAGAAQDHATNSSDQDAPIHHVFGIVAPSPSPSAEAAGPLAPQAKTEEFLAPGPQVVQETRSPAGPSNGLVAHREGQQSGGLHLGLGLETPDGAEGLRLELSSRSRTPVRSSRSRSPSSTSPFFAGRSKSGTPGTPRAGLGPGMGLVGPGVEEEGARPLTVEELSLRGGMGAALLLSTGPAEGAEAGGEGAGGSQEMREGGEEQKQPGGAQRQEAQMTLLSSQPRPAPSSPPLEFPSLVACFASSPTPPGAAGQPGFAEAASLGAGGGASSASVLSFASGAVASPGPTLQLLGPAAEAQASRKRPRGGSAFAPAADATKGGVLGGNAPDSEQAEAGRASQAPTGSGAKSLSPTATGLTVERAKVPRLLTVPPSSPQRPIPLLPAPGPRGSPTPGVSPPGVVPGVAQHGAPLAPNLHPATVAAAAAAAADAAAAAAAVQQWNVAAAMAQAQAQVAAQAHAQAQALVNAMASAAAANSPLTSSAASSAPPKRRRGRIPRSARQPTKVVVRPLAMKPSQ